MTKAGMILLAAVVATSTFLAAGLAEGGYTYNWNVAGGGTWTSAANWTSTDGTTYPSAMDDTAIFAQSTVGSVSLGTSGSSVTVGNMAFSTSGWWVTDTGNTLILDTDTSVNSAPTISVTSGASASLSTKLAGNDGLIKTGAGTMVLANKVAGAISFTGDAIVNEGTLQIGNTNSHTPSLFDSSSRTIYVNNGAMLKFFYRNVFCTAAGSTGTKIVVDGGAVSSLHDSAVNVLQDLTLKNGATLEARNGGVFGTYVLRGTTTVGGTSSSSITAGASAAKFSIGNGTDNTGVTTFDVADVTGNSNADLTVGCGIGNCYDAAGTTALTSGLTKTGAGTMVLANTVTSGCSFTGDMIINEGTLQIGDANKHVPGLFTDSSRTIYVNKGASLTFLYRNVFGNVGSSTPATRVVVDGGTVSSGYDSTLNVLQDLALKNGATLQARNSSVHGTYVIKGTTTVSGTSSSSITAGASNAMITIGNNTDNTGVTTFNVADVTGNSNADLTVGCVIGNSYDAAGTTALTSGLTKTGNGTMILAADNTYTGTTTVNAGTMQIGTGSTAGSLQSSGIVNNAALVYNMSSSKTYSGNISGSGSLTTMGSGTLILAGSNTYSGNTTVSAGALAATSAASLPGYSDSNRVSVAGGAAIAVVVGGTGGWSQGEIDSLLSHANFADGSTLGMDTTYGDFAYASDISGNRGFAKTGANKLTLGGNSTYTGATTVNAGTLQVGDGTAAASIGATGALYVNNGAGVEIKNGSSLSTTGSLVVGNASSASLSTLTISGGTLSQTGSNQNATMIGDAAAAPGKLVISAGLVNIVTSGTTSGDGTPVVAVGGVAAAGTGSVEQSGGTISITRADGVTTNKLNGFSLGAYAGGKGTYTMSGGELIVGKYVDSTADGDTEMNMFVGYKGQGTFTQTGGAVNVSRKLTIGCSTDSSLYDMSAGNGILNVAADMNVGDGGHGTLLIGDNSAVTAGMIRLSRTDSTNTISTITMTGGSLSTGSVYIYNNTGSATLNIQGGLMCVTGTAGIASNGSADGAINLSAGVLDLQGNGIAAIEAFNFTGGELRNANVGFSLAQSGGRYAVSGNTVTGDYSLGSAATLALDVGTAACDKLTVGGAATFNGTIAISLMDGYTAAVGDSFDILDFASLSGTPTWDLAALGDGLTWNTNSFASTGVISITAVPEPTTIAMLLGAMLGLIAYAWRKRR